MVETGQRLLAVPKDWHPSHGIPSDQFPDAVVFDCDDKRHAYYVAGYYRGVGLPVVYVTDGHGRATRRFASRTGCYVCVGMAEFGRWLSSDPPYLHRG